MHKSKSAEIVFIKQLRENAKKKTCELQIVAIFHII
jgi:hypothetical protein